MSNLQRKTNSLYGIECWLRSKGFTVNTYFTSRVTAAFLKSKGLKYVKYNPRYKGLFTADICNAETIQKHFKQFQIFVIENYDKIKIT